MQFITKPQQIQAIQWTGENFEEIHAFVGNAMVARKHELVYLDLSVASAPMKISDFILLDGLGLSVMAAEDFAAIHQPAVPPAVKSLDGLFIVEIPIRLVIPVDPLHGFTEQESLQVALDRLAELPLEITLGGVPLTALASIPLFQDSNDD